MNAASGATAGEFEREMGITHAEFFRSLPAAIQHRQHHVSGTTVTVVVSDEGLLEIELGPERERRIALLRLPVTQVRFRFHAVAEADREAFMQRFDLYFRRGGG